MRSDFDLAIIGSGFGGALLAMIARRIIRPLRQRRENSVARYKAAALIPAHTNKKSESRRIVSTSPDYAIRANATGTE